MEHSNNVACISLKTLLTVFFIRFQWFGRLCENSLVWTRQHCLPIVWLVTVLNFLTYIGQKKNNFEKNFELKWRAFWIWFITNHFLWVHSTLTSFWDNLSAKSIRALTPLSFDSTLTSIIGKQPLWLSIFCSVWNLTLLLFFNFLLCLTAYHKVCMDFFRRKLIFMELTGMGQFHVIRMHKMLSLLMSPLLTQLMR